MEHSDAALVEQCLAGKKDAFEVLVLRHQNSVFNLALRMTGNNDEAIDIVQDTFIRAYRKLRHYDAGYSFRNWILSICANLVKNRFRSVSRARQAEKTHLELFLRESNPDQSPQIVLDEALKLIPETNRLPLILKHVEGLSYEEVARILKIGVSAAKMRVKRGREELVGILYPHGGEIR